MGLRASSVRPSGPVYLRLVAEHGATGADWFAWFVRLDRQAADAMGNTITMVAASQSLDESARLDLHKATEGEAPGSWRRAQFRAFQWLTEAEVRAAADAYLASVEHRAAVDRMERDDRRRRRTEITVRELVSINMPSEPMEIGTVRKPAGTGRRPSSRVRSKP